MASRKSSGATVYSGAGKHQDKRQRRARTRSAAKRRAIKEG